MAFKLGKKHLDDAWSDVDAANFDEMLKEATDIFGLGLSHRLDELYEICDKQSKESMYHALLAGLFEAVESVTQLDKNAMQASLARLKIATDTANKRRKTGWSKLFFKPDYDSYNEVEVHAELVYADSLIFTAVVTVLSDQSILGFINAALAVKTSYQSYQECNNILKQRTKWRSNTSRMHFESGVRMAIGAFDLMISFFPAKFIKLLEFAGFSGNRTFGIKELSEAEANTEGLRWPVAASLLGMYNLFLQYVYGLAEPDRVVCNQISAKGRECYPESAYFGVISSLTDLSKGNFNEALKGFEACNNSKMPSQMQYGTRLFMAWTCALSNNWSEAVEHSKFLLNCTWSPAAFHYFHAICLSMLMEEENKPELRDEVIRLLKEVPKLKRTLGGKKALHEKFVLGRSKAFCESPENLLFAPLEMAYIFNFTQWMEGRTELIAPHLAKIENKLSLLKLQSENSKKYFDQLANLTFFKGVLLRLSGNQNVQAKESFLSIFQFEKRIENENHIPALAAFELGLMHRKEESFASAKEWLNKARNNYSGHFAETLINYRSDLAFESMKNVKCNKRTSSTDVDARNSVMRG